jgi:SAM-dependent methyltransferase
VALCAFARELAAAAFAPLDPERGSTSGRSIASRRSSPSWSRASSTTASRSGGSGRCSKRSERTAATGNTRAYCEPQLGRRGSYRTLGGETDRAESSFVVELASNDGYLLRNFVARGIPCLGVEPAANVAGAAEAAGVPTRVEFFGRRCADALAAERGHADLVVVTNVLAQAPDPSDFVAGIARLLAPKGHVALEFSHLLALIEGRLCRRRASHR